MMRLFQSVPPKFARFGSTILISDEVYAYEPHGHATGRRPYAGGWR
ncbi:MAG: hypothetical protein IPM53_18430 [Anaerolineaceae bacterium]|nr:hypothetical protein [Anaerolineaceae bacterium]